MAARYYYFGIGKKYSFNIFTSWIIAFIIYLIAKNFGFNFIAILSKWYLIITIGIIGFFIFLIVFFVFFILILGFFLKTKKTKFSYHEDKTNNSKEKINKNQVIDAEFEELK